MLLLIFYICSSDNGRCFNDCPPLLGFACDAHAPRLRRGPLPLIEILFTAFQINLTLFLFFISILPVTEDVLTIALRFCSAKCSRTPPAAWSSSGYHFLSSKMAFPPQTSPFDLQS